MHALKETGEVEVLQRNCFTLWVGSGVKPNTVLSSDRVTSQGQRQQDDVFRSIPAALLGDVVSTDT